MQQNQFYAMLANYWWGSTENKKKIHWASWKKLCNTKANGIWLYLVSRYGASSQTHRDLWQECIRHMQIDRTSEDTNKPLDFRDLLESRWNRLPRRLLIDWIIGIWHIWYERNRRINGVDTATSDPVSFGLIEWNWTLSPFSV
ncbi:hypothetical protein LIER_37999 [Lithospermum erythrorhizon]|uniref:Uncharacterized protein n=1 Tax=Lithospermum erythrorhizon TaxID=34254 RepID=A0AAV3PT50_LITER